MQKEINDSQNATSDHRLLIQDLALAGLLSIVIVITVIGNTLVILAVVTTRRLRTVTNCFVMSVAIADWLVGIFVMPPAVALRLMGKWELGWVLCDVWVSLDILLCTASILSLCAISVDRYLAVTQPLSYSRKRRSKRLAFSMILAVWFISALITCPPMFGWYESGRHNEKNCRYNKNAGYVVFSAMFSFFIPMVIMLYVYVRISCIVAQRHDQLSHVSRARKSQKLVLHAREESDLDRASSECEERNVKCTRYISQISARGCLKTSMAAAFGSPLRLAYAAANLSIQFPQKLRQRRQHASGAYTGHFIGNVPSAGGHPNLRLTSRCRFLWQSPLTTGICSGRISTGDALNQNNHTETRKNGSHSRSMRSTLNYSFASEPVTPQRTASLYTSTALSTNRSRPESLQLDVSILNFEPATRVSSFRRETKTAQTLSIVVGGFIACWLPFFIYYLLTPVLPESEINSAVMGYLTWLGWINSAINPFIYAFYSPDFRIAFWRLTFRHFSKSRRADMAFQHK